MTNDQYWYLKDYVRVPYHQHIQWVQDFLRDHYRLEHGRTLVLLAKDGIRGIVQQTGESVNTHNNIQDWHLENSPDISCLFCVSDNEKPAEIVFEYDDGRNRHRRWKVPMEKNTFVIFSSSLNHYITKNEDKDFLVNLSLQFQLI